MATNPLWVLKTRQQTAACASELQATPHFGALVRREGLRCLMRGVAPALLLVSYNALQLPLYATARHELAWPRFPAVLASVATASAATYPLQVVRTRFQAERVGAASAAAGDRAYTSFASVLRHARTAEQGGALAALYRGFSPHLLRSVAGWYVRFAVAEALAQRWQTAGKVV